MTTIPAEPRPTPADGWTVLELLGAWTLLLAALMVITAAARIGDAMIGVSGASRDAARAATLQREAGQAAAAASDRARAALSDKGLACAGGPGVTADTGQFLPGGQVSVEITCQVSLGDLVGVALPGTVTITRAAASPIEQFRSGEESASL